MTAPVETLDRIRILRRDSYKCRWRNREHSPICGAPASHVGMALHSDELVALCMKHSLN